MKEEVANWLSAVTVLTPYTLIILQLVERWQDRLKLKGQVIVSWGSKIKPLIWKDQRNRVTWFSHRRVCVCVCMASDSAQFQWRRRHQKAVTYTHKCRCTSFVQQVIPLLSWPSRNLHVHTSYSSTTTCHSVPRTESTPQLRKLPVLHYNAHACTNADSCWTVQVNPCTPTHPSAFSTCILIPIWKGTLVCVYVDLQLALK